jgi:spore coat protein A
MDRQAFDVVTGQPTGPVFGAAANETGWKDTVQAPPGMITRVITRFEDFQGLFPYHCHILEHEDHEMMRQFEVRPACPADIAPAGNVNNAVDADDLVAVILAWGACPPPCPPGCFADIDRNCDVNADDLVAVILQWGACR